MLFPQKIKVVANARHLNPHHEIVVVQNDTAVEFLVAVIGDNGQTSLPSETSYVLTSLHVRKRPTQKLGVMQEDGNILFDLDQAELGKTGTVQAYIQAYHPEKGRVTSHPFTYHVAPDPIYGAEIHPPDKSLIEQVIGEGPSIIAEAKAETELSITERTRLTDEVDGALLEMSQSKDAADQSAQVAQQAADNADDERERLTLDVSNKLDEVETARSATVDATGEATEAAGLARDEAEAARLQKDEVQQILGAGPVASVNGETGVVTGLATQESMNQVTAQLADIVVNVKSFGATGDGVTDDTQAIINALNSSNNVFFPDGDYLITLANQDVKRSVIYEFANRKNIRITGKGAKIKDVTNYTKNVLTDIFRFIDCENIYIDVNYEANPIVSPNENLGYFGSSFVYLEGNTKNITVDSIINHARYGVRAGGYENLGTGTSKNINLNLTTFMTGYPTALYLAESIIAKINAEGVHRAAYLAGVHGAELNIKFKDQYVVDTVLLMTDAKISEGVSRGCSGIKANVQDTGSTVFQPSSSCAGITLSRVDPDTIFSDIDIHVNVKANDTTATTVGAFKVSSVAKVNQPIYPYNWESYIYLKNIKISGIIDRSKQTTPANTAGDIYFFAEENYQHFATVSNISFEDLTIIPSVGDTRKLYFYARGLKDIANFKNFNAGSSSLEMVTNTTSETLFTNSKLESLAGFQSKLSFVNSEIKTVTNDSLTNSTSINSTFSGAGLAIKNKQVELNLVGANTIWTTGIPRGVLVLGLVGRLIEPVQGASGLQIGVTGDLSRYLNTNSLSSGTTFTPANQALSETTPRYYLSNTDVIITAKTADFTAGKIKLLLTYIDFTAPTI